VKGMVEGGSVEEEDRKQGRSRQEEMNSNEETERGGEERGQ